MSGWTEFFFMRGISWVIQVGSRIGFGGYILLNGDRVTSYGVFINGGIGRGATVPGGICVGHCCKINMKIGVSDNKYGDLNVLNWCLCFSIIFQIVNNKYV